jgi:hypothetical protein
MPDACFIETAHPSPRPARAPCPTNQQVGKAVDALTLKALLAIPLTAVSPGQDYRFCAAPDCPTVYYRLDGEQVFDETDLRERVYQKHWHDDEALVCYCFLVAVGEIRAEIERTGGSLAAERITAGIQAGQCACEIRNPQGECCLGNVREVARRLTAELNASATQET